MKFTRSCVACRKKANKYTFIRIVSDSGTAMVDKTGKMNSRGIYVCKDKNCIDKLLKSKHINKIIKNGIESESLKKVLIEMEDM